MLERREKREKGGEREKFYRKKKERF